MSKVSKAVASEQIAKNLRLDESVTNFMGGDSYVVNPLVTMKMITASSIFGEPSYYRGSKLSRHSKPYYTDGLLGEESILPKEFEGKKTEEIMESAIDKALDFNFKGTLEWAVTLRQKFNMRLNPQVIMVRAAMHPGRKEFTSKNGGAFNQYNQKVMQRGDDAMIQMAYYMFKHGSKNNMPSILKRSWSDNIDNMDRYSMAKYKSHEIGLINAVRLCHASKGLVPELMLNGTVEVLEEQETWERLRSGGESWINIFNTCKMGHMAMLRNLRGFLREAENMSDTDKYLDSLLNGVSKGKQFPFRYYRAYMEISGAPDIRNDFRDAALNVLDRCMSIAVDNLPRIKGKTMCLSDNSGSAWSGFTSEYGKTVIAEIDNISAVIAAMRSDEGYVGKFGDRLKVFRISKHRGVLEQAKEISHRRDYDVGGSTEGGIWEFFKDAIEAKEHWDNIFIFSDQQAGHGGLYGTEYQYLKYRSQGYDCKGSHINVFKLVLDYRKAVNKKVNVFSIQTAGYDNVLIPEYTYRTNILYGWTGKEVEFAATMIDQWDEVDKLKQ